MLNIISASVQFSCIRLFAIPQAAAHLSITNFRSLCKLTSIEQVITIQPSHPLSSPSPLTSIFPSIRVFPNESVLHIRWPKCWSFSISPSNVNPGLIPLGLTDWLSLQFKGLSRVFSNTTVQKHQFFSTQLSLWSNSHNHT